MRITRFDGAGCMVAQFEGRLDASAVEEATSVLLEIVPKGAVVADFTQVPFVSSAGLRVLLRAATLAKSMGTRFAVCGLQPTVREVFEISGFDRIVALHANLAEATGAG